MSVGANEPNNGPDQSIKINPNWNPLLEKLPESLHQLILPDLQQWDQGVQQKLNETRQQYEPYKDLIDQGLDPEEIERAFALQQAINNDPASFIKNAVDYFSKNVDGWDLTLAEQQQLQEASEFSDLNDGEINVDDLKKDPRFKELFSQVDEARQFMEEYREAEEDAEAEEELEQYLKDLHEELGDFDDMYVAALLTQDIDGKVAVQQFQNMINQAATALQGGDPPNTQQQQFNQPRNTGTQPPVVMGQGGSIGSGLPDGKIKMGDLNRNQTKDLVVQMLEAANNPQT